MTSIKYTEDNGTEHLIDVNPGLSLMEGAVRNNIPGIDADCGGACSCATCHVYVDDPRINERSSISAIEEAMLDCVEDRRATSRLSCQVIVSGDMDGLIVQLPKSQR